MIRCGSGRPFAGAVAALALLLAAGEVRAQGLRPIVRIEDATSRGMTPHAPGIAAAELAEHVAALASDEMEGRETGSLGGLRAALYIAQRLRQAGVEAAHPVARDGSELSGYLQDIGYVGFPLATEPRLLAKLALPDEEGGETVVEAAHGVDFDYVVGAPVEGNLELVVVTSREQAEAVSPSRERALFLHGPYLDRLRWLEVMGSPGGKGWGVVLTPGWPTRGAPRRLPLHGVASKIDPTLPAMLRVRGPLRDTLARSSGGTLHVVIEALERTPAYNVVGVIPGRGTEERPGLAREAVVFTAHYDHIGTRGRARPGERDADDPAPDDLVYNGADDDASGVAAVLELAHAFAAGPPPARTLVFLLVTGEEKGLLGTEFYLDHPVRPLEDTVYNMNFEMIGRPDAAVGGPGRLWITGPERTTVMDALNAGGIEIAPDARPEQNFFMRSDNIAFVRRGIPAQSFSSYDMHADYHQVTDEADTLDPAHMEAAVRAALQAARLMADGELDPAWTEGGNPYAPSDDAPGS